MLPKCNSWLKFSNSNIFAETPSLFFFKASRTIGLSSIFHCRRPKEKPQSTRESELYGFCNIVSPNFAQKLKYEFQIIQSCPYHCCNNTCLNSVHTAWTREVRVPATQCVPVCLRVSTVQHQQPLHLQWLAQKQQLANLCWNWTQRNRPRIKSRLY